VRAALSLLLVAFGQLSAVAMAQERPTPATLPNRAGSAIYITHVTVIDTETGKEIQDRTVVLSGDRISEVRDSKGVKAPAGAKVVDGRGRYLIPGLWDMHVHRTEYEAAYVMYLANGVTGVRDMDGPLDANKFRAELAAKKIDAPHIFLGSPIVDGYPPRFPDVMAVRTVEEARRFVDEQKQRGADFIKVYDRLSRDSYFAIIDEGRRQGISVVGHVPFVIGAWEASDSGQKSIEHLHAIPLACSNREAELRAKLVASQTSWKVWNPIYVEAYRSYSDGKCQQLFAEFKRNPTWSVPTLVVFRAAALSNDAQFRNDDRLRYFGGQMRTWLARNYVAERSTFDASDLAMERDLLRYRKQLVGTMFRAGVPMLAGTDTPNAFCFPGFGLHDELALMVESGVSPLGALQAATRNPAILMDATDRYGSVAPGKIADLVLLDSDPLKDIHNTTKISEVFLAGREFDRAALDKMLRNAEAAAKAGLVN
jgi:Amidohydrolase family